MGVVIGIDPGISGGISVFRLDEDDTIGWAMPIIKVAKGNAISVEGVLDILQPVRFVAKLVLIERVGSQPTDGHQAAFKFGFNVGILHGIVRTLGLPMDTVTPQKWQKAILGSFEPGQSKAASVAFCKRRWPGLSLLPTERCKKPSDGIADAACIAEYARRQVVGDGKIEEPLFDGGLV